MTTFIVATDGSELAIEAATAGLSLTKQVDQLVIVCAVHLVDAESDATGHAGPTMTSEQIDASRRDSTAEGQAAVAAMAEALGEIGYEPEQVETLVVEGDAGPALCEAAANLGASAMIVGSRGRGGIKRALLGSVSDYVVRNAPCSVVVSRSQAS